MFIIKKLLLISCLFSIFIFCICFTPLVNFLYSFLEIKPQLNNSDAIVLLSSEQYGEHIFGVNTYQRMFHAFSLYQHGYGNKLIVVCGVSLERAINQNYLDTNLSKFPNRSSIAESIKDMLVMIGVDENRVVVETTSRNTYENFLKIKPILRNMGIDKILLVTSSYHMFRSLAVSKKLEIKAYPAPVPCYEKNIAHPISRLKLSIEVIREYCAIVYFWLRGWI